MVINTVRAVDGTIVLQELERGLREMTGTLGSELIIASGICSIPARLLRTRKCRGTMKIIAFITDYQAVDRIIDHLKLTFAAAKPPPMSPPSTSDFSSLIIQVAV